MDSAFRWCIGIPAAAPLGIYFAISGDPRVSILCIGRRAADRIPKSARQPRENRDTDFARAETMIDRLKARPHNGLPGIFAARSSVSSIARLHAESCFKGARRD